MSNERIAEVVLRQHGVVARRQLLGCGLTPDAISSRIRNGRLVLVVRSVYSLGPHVSSWGHRYAAVLAVDPQVGYGPKPRRDARAGRHAEVGTAPRAGTRDIGREIYAEVGATHPSRDTTTGAVLSHWSAAQAYGLAPTTRHRQHVTLTGTGGRTSTAVRTHRARTLLPVEVSIVEGLPVTSPARTILDCATGASVGQVRKLIREAEYQRLLGPGAIAAALRLRPYHPGRSVAREADPQTTEAALGQTPLEDRVAVLLAGLPLPAAVPQHPLVGASGQRYRADFAWLGLRLIVEADGRPAHDRSTSFDSDRARDADLAAAGWMTLRFTSVMLRDPSRVAATILATARTRGYVSPAAARSGTAGGVDSAGAADAGFGPIRR